MKTGLFFGSFNPIHVGHLIMANHILNENLVEKIWFVVSPHNPLKNNSQLLRDYDRLYLAKTATEDDLRIKVSDVEFHLPKPSYTITTLIYLEENFPNYQFFIIMGSDSFKNIHRWKNFESIIKNYQIIVFKRSGFEIKNELNAKIQVIEAPVLDVSATAIRTLIMKQQSIRYLVPDKVREEIERCGFFKKKSK